MCPPFTIKGSESNNSFINIELTNIDPQSLFLNYKKRMVY